MSSVAYDIQTKVILTVDLFNYQCSPPTEIQQIDGKYLQEYLQVLQVFIELEPSYLFVVVLMLMKLQVKSQSN